EAGHGASERGECGGDGVDDAPTTEGCDAAEDDRHRDADEESETGELEGGSNGFANELAGTPVLGEGPAEVERNDRSHVIDVLLQQRPVQSQLGAEFV